MRVLITGANGFIGRNIVSVLQEKESVEIYKFDRENSYDDLVTFVNNTDFIIHLAGINRPLNDSEFMQGNYELTKQLIDIVRTTNRDIPILMSSSIHASKKSDYGLSKKAAEDSLNQFRDEGNHTIYIYRLPNVFGKWCRPNYNSVIATFCHNISRGIPVRIDDPNNEVNLVYIDDVVSEFCNALDGYPNEKLNGFCFVEPIYQKKLINIVEKLNSFNNSRDDLSLPNVGDEFEKKLYSTFLSYYEPTNFSYFLKMNHDNRGSFTEFLKTTKYGQVSVNVSKPGITKGNHWHSTKSEKFLVVSGSASIKFRSVNDTVIYEYVVSGEKMEVVDIPPGFTHNITTLGTEKSVTLMWANEEFDPENTDTFYLEV